MTKCTVRCPINLLLSRLKREKLRLKDEMARLNGSQDGSCSP